MKLENELLLGKRVQAQGVPMEAMQFRVVRWLHDSTMCSLPPSESASVLSRSDKASPLGEAGRRSSLRSALSSSSRLPIWMPTSEMP